MDFVSDFLYHHFLSHQNSHVYDLVIQELQEPGCVDMLVRKLNDKDVIWKLSKEYVTHKKKGRTSSSSWKCVRKRAGLVWRWKWGKDVLSGWMDGWMAMGP